MRQITNCHPADITKLLQGLVSRGILLQDGQSRWTTYHLPSMQTINQGPNSLHKDNHSLHKDDRSLHKDDHSLHIEEISPEEWIELKQLALPANQSKRLPPPQMEAIILRLCKERWLTRKQISELVNRNKEAVLTRFLTPMVEHKLLELRYPDKPNRTDQAYRAVMSQNNPAEQSHTFRLV